MSETFQISHAALVLVDVQAGFRDPSWGRSANFSEALANIAALGQAWEASGLPLVKVRHDSAHPLSTLRAGSLGNRFMAEVLELREDLLVTKTVNSSFLGTPDLARWLRSRSLGTIVVAGIQTNLCVETTARMGGNLGFEALIPLDATTTFDLEGPALAGGPPLRLTAEELMTATAVNLHGDGFARVTNTAGILKHLAGKPVREAAPATPTAMVLPANANETAGFGGKGRMMHLRLSELRPHLVRSRIFLMGPGAKTIETTGASYGEDSLIKFAPDLRLESYATYWAGSGRHLVSLGSFSYTHSRLPLSTRVGRYTSIAKGVKVMGARHPHEWASTSPVFYNRRLMMETFERDRGETPAYRKFDYEPDPVVVGNDVWIGENVTLGHGVHIGDGAVVASNSVVTRDVPPYAVVAGVPAKTIRQRFDDRTANDLVRSAWWDYSPTALNQLDVRNPAEFARGAIGLIDAGAIEPYRPPVLTGRELAAAVAGVGSTTA